MVNIFPNINQSMQGLTFRPLFERFMLAKAFSIRKDLYLANIESEKNNSSSWLTLFDSRSDN